MQEAHARRPHRRIAGRAGPKTWSDFNCLRLLTKSARSTGPETTGVWRPVFLVRSATVGQQPTAQTHGTIGLFCAGRRRRDASIGGNWRRERYREQMVSAARYSICPIISIGYNFSPDAPRCRVGLAPANPTCNLLQSTKLPPPSVCDPFNRTAKSAPRSALTLPDTTVMPPMTSART